MEFDEEVFKMHAEFCSLFSNMVRMKIFWVLRSGETTAGKLAEEIGVSAPNISQHLRLMRDRGAVTTRKEGKQVYYKIANEHFVNGAALIRKGVLEEWKKGAKRADSAPSQ